VRARQGKVAVLKQVEASGLLFYVVGLVLL
jgi:hypothetical protein